MPVHFHCPLVLSKGSVYVLSDSQSITNTEDAQAGEQNILLPYRVIPCHLYSPSTSQDILLSSSVSASIIKIHDADFGAQNNFDPYAAIPPHFAFLAQDTEWRAFLLFLRQ